MNWWTELSRARRGALVAGTLAVLAVPLSRPLGLSASQDLSSGKIVLAAVGLLLLAASTLGPKLFNAYKGLALLLLNTAVVLIAIESSLLILARIHDAFEPPGDSRTQETTFVGDGRENLPYYREVPWGETFWTEYAEAWNPERLRFEPYLVWSTPPFAGETINIHERAVRDTPTSRCEENSILVFTLGGSTMWGTGVPDDGTIASHLAGTRNERSDRPICVRNLAEQAYVSTQELLRLIFELRAGARPDVVIFYDGINDVFAAYQSGEAGLPQNLEELRIRLRDAEPEGSMFEPLERTRTLKLARKLTGRTRLKVSPYDPAARGLDLEALAVEVADLARANYDLAQSLGRTYAFETHFFWQPLMLLGEKTMTEEEASIYRIANSVHPGLQDLYRSTYGRLAKTNHTEIHRLTHLFRDRTELVYVDPWHVTVEGNRTIATAMADTIPPLGQ